MNPEKDVKKCSSCGCRKLLKFFKIRQSTGEYYKTCMQCCEKDTAGRKKYEDYSEGIIYCLKSGQTDDVYYGSTTRPLPLRKASHMKAYKSWLAGKNNYVTSYEIVKYDDFYIEIVEKYPCKSKEELLTRESHYIKSEKCVNRYIPGRTSKQWNEDNHEKVLENKRRYHRENREEILEKKRLYRIENREKIAERGKQRYEKNHEKNLEKARLYREKNREQIKERQCVKVKCGCGSTVQKHCLTRHLKSKKHLKWIDNQ